MAARVACDHHRGIAPLALAAPRHGAAKVDGRARMGAAYGSSSGAPTRMAATAA